MNLESIGRRIRTQREAMGYTREQFAELLDVTPKFCSDIELGIKGMSVPTLCKISEVLQLTTDYILFGFEVGKDTTIEVMLHKASPSERHYAEALLMTYFKAMQSKGNQAKT